VPLESPGMGSDRAPGLGRAVVGLRVSLDPGGGTAEGENGTEGLVGLGDIKDAPGRGATPEQDETCSVTSSKTSPQKGQDTSTFLF
jgi:hypothetical protein